LTPYLGTGCNLAYTGTGSVRDDRIPLRLCRKKTNMPEVSSNTNQRSLIAAILASIGASLCCVGPLVLLTLGIGGSWISTLTALEPIRPIFIVITLVFIFLAFRKLYLLPVSCELDQPCARPETRRNQRILFWLLSALIIALLAFPYYAEYLID